MVAIGMGLVFIGYTVGIVGYCWVRGYNVTFMQAFGPTWAAPPAREGGGNPVQLPGAREGGGSPVLGG